MSDSCFVLRYRNTWTKLLELQILSYSCRLLFGLEFAFLVWWTPKVKHEGGFPVYYYVVVLLSYALHQVTYTVWEAKGNRRAFHIS